MNIESLLDLNYKSLQCHEPDRLKLIEPRKILTPQGYAPARHVASILDLLMSQCAAKAKIKALGPTVETSAYTILGDVIANGVPIYYVSKALAEAVAATEPPPNFTIGDMNWPMPSIVLGFPKEFMKQYADLDACYVFCSRVEAGEHYSGYPGCPTTVVPQPKAGVVCMVNSGGVGRNLISAYFLDEKLDGVFDRYTYVNLSHDTNPEKSKENVDMITALVYKLLIILSVKPAYRTEGGCVRKAIIRKGEERNALWAPNFIGEHYKPPGMAMGGTHASPRMHRKRGHCKMQAHGPQLSLRKWMWIEPYWVGLQ